MRCRTKWLTTAAFLAIASTVGLASAPAARAGDGVILGTLTCNKTGQGQTYVLYSRVPVECSYTGQNGPAKYTGTSGILLGVDLEIEDEANFSFIVMGGTGSSGAGLEGYYVGVKASVTPAVGIAAQAGLVGFGGGVSLVPVGLGYQKGVGVSGGISYLDIK